MEKPRGIIIIGAHAPGKSICTEARIAHIKAGGDAQSEIPLIVDYSGPTSSTAVDEILAQRKLEAEQRHEIIKQEAEQNMRFFEKEDRFAYGPPTRAERRATQRKLQKKNR